MRSSLVAKMTLRRRTFLWLIGVFIVVVFVLTTGGSDAWLSPFQATAESTSIGPVDQSIYATSRNLARLAATPQEQHFAVLALRVADHELDQSFVSAIRNSTLHYDLTNPNVAIGMNRVAELKSAIKQDHAGIAALQNDLTSDTDEKNEKLRLAEAQLALDNDELENAQQDLARFDAYKKSEVQQVFDQHHLIEDQAAALPKDTATAALETPTALQSFRGKLKVRSLLVEREQLIKEARTKVSASLAALMAEHNRLDRSGSSAGVPPSETSQARIARLNSLAEQQKDMSDLDHRIRDLNQLQQVYDDWQHLLKQQLHALHLGLANDSLALTMAILGAFALSGVIQVLFRRWERKHFHRLDNVRLLVLVILQVLVAIRLFTILFGTPSDISTLLGLVTAGITIVLRDFIMSFVGWFLLMGRSGVRVGDWVEINGTQGEVAQITRLHTFVLETGNWTTDGHPTGRQAIFMNKFAVEGKYFNFSTPEQWLWDQLSIPVPAGTPITSELLAKMRDVVEAETREDSRRAERSWRELVRSHGLLEFAPTPTVVIRTSPSGLEITIRYVAKAECRFGTSVLLRQAVLAILGLVKDEHTFDQF